MVKQIRSFNKDKDSKISDKLWRNMQIKAYDEGFFLLNMENNPLNMKLIKYKIIKQARLVRKKRDKVQSLTAKILMLRYYYTRYAIGSLWVI